MGSNIYVSEGKLVAEDGAYFPPSMFEVNANGTVTTYNGVEVPIPEVAITAEGIHAALVTLGLITAPEE